MINYYLDLANITYISCQMFVRIICYLQYFEESLHLIFVDFVYTVFGLFCYDAERFVEANLVVTLQYTLLRYC